MPLDEINALKINMAEIKIELKNFSDNLCEHIISQKENDKKVEENFGKVLSKIDHLSDTFEIKVQSKADHKEIVAITDGLSSQITDLDKRFAPYFIFQVLVWMGGIIGMTLILGTIGVIANAFLHFYK